MKNRVHCETKSRQSSFGKSFKPVIFLFKRIVDTAFCLVGRLFTNTKLCFSTHFRQHMRGSDTKRYDLVSQYFETTLFCQVIALSELDRARSAQRLVQMCRYSRFALMQNKQRYSTSRTKLSTDKTVGYFENKDKFAVKKKYTKSIG